MDSYSYIKVIWYDVHLANILHGLLLLFSAFEHHGSSILIEMNFVDIKFTISLLKLSMTHSNLM